MVRSALAYPAGVQVLEAGQWLFANGQAMALQPVLLQTAAQNAGVTEAYAGTSAAATTAPAGASLTALPPLPVSPALRASPRQRP